VSFSEFPPAEYVSQDVPQVHFPKSLAEPPNPPKPPPPPAPAPGAPERPHAQSVVGGALIGVGDFVASLMALNWASAFLSPVLCPDEFNGLSAIGRLDLVRTRRFRDS